MTASAKINSAAFDCLISLIAVMVLSVAAGAQASQPRPAGSGATYTLHLDANIVILSATVLDRHDALVSGLSKNDFQIYEDGVLQQIRYFSHDDIPVTAGILVDNSGSMASKRDDVIAAALAFVRSSNPQDQMFVVNFNDRVSFGLPADVPFTDRRDNCKQRSLGSGRSAKHRCTTELPPPSAISGREPRQESADPDQRRRR